MTRPDPISIGADCGGPEAARVAQAKTPLVKAFSQFVNSTHCSEIDEYALVLRVDGPLAQFGQEGIFRLRLAKAKRYISVDIHIPQSVWEPMLPQQLRDYLAKQCAAAMKACVARLKKERMVVEESALWQEFEQAIQSYTSEPQA